MKHIQTHSIVSYPPIKDESAYGGNEWLDEKHFIWLNAQGFHPSAHPQS
jgi:hypothetical protein